MCLHVCVCVCSLWWAQEMRLSLDVQKPALHTVQFKDSSLEPSGRVDQSAALSPTSPCLAWGGSSRGDSFAGHRTSHVSPFTFTRMAVSSQRGLTTLQLSLFSGRISLFLDCI